MILPFYFLFSIVPGGLLLWVSSRIRQGQPPEEAARRLFYFLLLVFFTLLVFVMALDPQYQTSFWTIPFIPILTALIPIIYLHWRATPSLHTRQITLTLWLAIIAAILLGFVYGQIRRDIFLPLVVFGSGCVVTVVWWAVRLSRWGRIMTRIGIAVLLAGVGINTFAQNALLETWPGWLQVLLDAMTWLLAAVLTAQVGKLLYAHATGRFSQNRRPMLAAWGVVGLMACLLFYQTAETAILDTATDGLGTVMIFTIISLAAIAVALLLAWKLEQRRFQTVFVYVTAMMLTITVAFTVVTRLDPQQVMAERAE
ncbi:MAG: hypothetical protein K8I30_12575, partial [Anaerolineae bacterium]|nr:hypothetical protein [Anaerolineae bacterium]